jgi:hypothetical protein
MTYTLDPRLVSAPTEQLGVDPVALDDPDIENALREAGFPADADTAEPGASGEASGRVGSPDRPTAAPDRVPAARNLLAGVGLDEVLGTRTQRVTVRKVTLDVELD